MLDLHEELFTEFRDAARALRIYPQKAAHAWADTAYSQKFERWQDELGIHAIDLPFTVNGFDRVWIFNLTSRPGNNRTWTSALPLTIVACGAQTGKLHILSVDSNIRHLRHLLSEDRRELISILEGTYSLRPVFGVLSDKFYEHSTDYPHLSKTLYSRVAKASKLAAAVTEQANNALKYPGDKREPLRALAGETAKRLMDEKLADVLAEIDSYVDHEAMAFAEAFCASTSVKDKITPLLIYNHIVAASGPQGRGTRMGALPIIAKSGSLFLNDPGVWADIDNGVSLYAALKNPANASPGTIKHMLRQPALFGRGQDYFCEIAPWLDAINVQRWPATPEEVKLFKHMSVLANAYGTAFSRNKFHTLAQWVKDSGARATWRHMIFIRLKKTMRNLLRDPQHLAKQLGLPHPYRVDPTGEVPHPDLAPLKLSRNGKFWPKAVAQYTSALTNINHAKQDVERRIMRAALYRSLETQGWRVTDSDALNPLEDSIRERLWRDCPPHEQIEISDYWHSPNVNFGMRLNSLTQTEGMVWNTTVSGGVRLAGGLTAHPLASNDALREEGDAMQHCVWSYGYNCLKNGHHIFSLRNDAGKRVSTLDLVEEWQDGQVRFKIREHKSIKNTKVPAIAESAAQQLIKILEKEHIDWEPIQKDRADFAAKEIDAAIGYDFRDAEQSQKIFDLYRPCLPRKALRQSGGTLDGLAAALGMDRAVADYLAKNPGRAGLAATTRPAAQRTPAP